MKGKFRGLKYLRIEKQENREICEIEILRVGILKNRKIRKLGNL